jgi:polyferredoxin
MRSVVPVRGLVGEGENSRRDKIAGAAKGKERQGRTVYLVNVDLFPLYSLLVISHVLVLVLLVLLVQVQIQTTTSPIPLFTPQPRQSRMDVVFLLVVVVVVDVVAVVVVVAGGRTACGLLCSGWSEYCWV